MRKYTARRAFILILAGFLWCAGLTGCGEDAVNDADGKGAARKAEDAARNADGTDGADGSEDADSGRAEGPGSLTGGEGGPGTSAENAAPDRAEDAETVMKDFLCDLYCTGSSLLAVGNERIFLLDGRTLEAKKEAENTAPSLLEPCLEQIGGEYCLTGYSLEEHRFGQIVYGAELEVERIIDLEEQLGAERELMDIEILQEGKGYLYNNILGLWLFDAASKKTTDLSQEGIFIDNFGYLEESDEILFDGPDASGAKVLGAVGPDGQRKREAVEGRLWGEINAFGDFALIGEAELVGREREGMVFRYDAGGEISGFPLSDEAENGNITVSCHGAYYATRTKMRDGVLNCVIRVYSSGDGSLVKELPVSYEEYGEDFRLRGFVLCDETDRIVLYGVSREQETDTRIITKSLSPRRK